MKLHAGQKKYLRETTKRNAKINILVPSNRWGKSALLACLQIWYLFYKFGIPPGNREAWLKAEYRTANVAPGASQVEAVFKYIHQIMTSTFAVRLPDGTLTTNKCLIDWFYLKERTNSQPPFKQYFSNNSYIEHRTIGGSAQDSLEGKPYGIITYDEGGRSNHLQSEVNGTFLARLFDWDGPLHIPSTPHQESTSILYHLKLYKDGLVGANNTYTMEGELKDNTFFSDEQIAKQYKLYEHNPLRDQVLFGKFVLGGDQIFNAEDILAAQDAKLNDGERAQESHNYVIGTDTAMGSDEIVHSVLDVTDLKVVRDETGETIEGEARLVRQLAARGNSKSPQRHINDFCDLFDAYTVDGIKPAHLLETWNGESARFYQDLPPYIQLQTTCYGSWQPEKRTSENKNQPRPKNMATKKADIVLSLQKLLGARAIKIFEIDPNPAAKDDADLSQQLSIYKEDDAGLPTDRVLSLAMAAYKALQQNVLQKEINWLNF